MDLFELSGAWSRIEATPVIDTPSGNVALQASLGSWSTALTTADALENAAGSKILRWESAVGRAELLLCRPQISLPGDLEVSDCWAGLWRVSPYVDVDSCGFEARWQPGHSWSNGGPDSGQDLDAQTWTDGVVRVSMGTHDGTAVLARAQAGDGLPKIWGSAAALRCIDAACSDLVRYDATSLFVPLPSLSVSEQAQIHFAIAWAPDIEHDASTWFAVDVQHAEILAGVGGSLVHIGPPSVGIAK